MKRSHLVLALSAENEIVATAGWIAVPEEPGTARIRKVFVHPSWARRGLQAGLSWTRSGARSPRVIPG